LGQSTLYAFELGVGFRELVLQPLDLGVGVRIGGALLRTNVRTAGSDVMGCYGRGRGEAIRSIQLRSEPAQVSASMA